ncbi:4-hydroxy-tetrahydrodipicolinate synthase [Paenibacillus mucilaginosus]|uniref:4-hydroxy-tetrahydrodipicolinate synthase n=2 Tax=Paenibacillus mucilaginosus TaxID=61624 RepID=H6NPB3_9BACL|nr:4-hydroxy-tetrahydrodipicolinate synthase [Paenibacillus mucilaginosus]AEI44280.1 DapA [Paenibacillus mucilaginosus KNP414]AFC31823.1 DapA [Paenibacillus mucilaginosus 3016]MCG7216688.1 4-hydroxy-tetrahydrodipicolinate synthase [Paenibacillus mucilaginosus]WDM25679.1 4-hydroxy-tetrahydrodipicolinate synthase [Paenibacillus mucilaginosus]WFA20334.1 4-hydroxy-tetrahydrodipicolinate synthase [Paenibacillus mucilaginosus]
MDFGRLITAMITPFNSDLQIDWEGFETVFDYLIDEQESDSLVICGTTGESPTLTEEEKLQLFEAAVKRAKGRCRIIAGTGSNDTAHSIHLSQAAEKLGVDALLLVAPYYNRPSQEGLYQHFKAIAESVSIPVILYNVPSRSSVNISAETTIRLSQIPNIVATKDCTGTDQLTQIVSGAAEGFLVYTGDDSAGLPALSVGAHGIVSVASHVVGKQMKQMIEAYLGGDVKQAAKLHGQLLPVFGGLFTFPSPAPVKAALSLKGLPAGGVRLPLVEANEAERKFIASLFE